MRRPCFIFSIFTLLLLTLPLLTTLPAFSQEAMGLSADPSAIASATAEASATEGQKQEAIREAEGHKQPAASATPAAQATTATPRYEKSTSKSPPPKPQIIIDEKTNTVRVLIGGKEVVTIDAKGLHVHGHIDYSGVITDTGEAPHEK